MVSGLLPNSAMILPHLRLGGLALHTDKREEPLEQLVYVLRDLVAHEHDD